MDFLHPIKYEKITSGFGWRVDPINGKQSFHKGLDYKAPLGTPVFPSLPANVAIIDTSKGFGLRIVLDHGGGLLTSYSHLQSVKVKKGESVNQSDIIALSGSSGRSTGAHLHFEIAINNKTVDPALYLKLPYKINQISSITTPLIILGAVAFFLVKN
jgi:murein DD-endopeptidase MepM/ murein hydrolase activator NlpD